MSNFIVTVVMLGVAVGGLIGWFSAEMGAKAERAKIVAWLRGRAETMQIRNALIEAALNIKAGEHLK